MSIEEGKRITEMMIRDVGRGKDVEEAVFLFLGLCTCFASPGPSSPHLFRVNDQLVHELISALLITPTSLLETHYTTLMLTPPNNHVLQHSCAYIASKTTRTRRRRGFLDPLTRRVPDSPLTVPV